MKYQATFADDKRKWEEEPFKASTNKRAIHKARKLVRDLQKKYVNQDVLSCKLDRIDPNGNRICIKAF